MTAMTVVELDALPAMDVAGRADRLRPLLADAGVDALLVTHLPNVRYLTGFTGSSAMLLVTDDALGVHLRRPLPHAGGRAARRRRRRRADRDRRHRRAAARRARRRARRPVRASGSKRTRSRGRSSERFAVALDGHELVPTDGLVERLRRIKEPAEVARIHAACSIADDALGALLPRLAERPDRARLRARARGRDATARRERQQLRPDRRVGPERRQAARPAERAAGRARASSSSSTSGASSTATAPT